MTRHQAIDLLARRDMAQLSHDQREGLLLDWWGIDESDPDYGTPPEELQIAMGSLDQPESPESSLFDPLVQIALRR